MSAVITSPVGSATAPVMHVVQQAAPQVVRGGSIIQGGSVQYGGYGGGSVISQQQPRYVQGGSVLGNSVGSFSAYPSMGYQQPFMGVQNGFQAFPTTLGNFGMQPITGVASVQAPVTASVSAPAGSVVAPANYSSVGMPPIIQGVSASAAAPLTYSAAAPTFASIQGGTTAAPVTFGGAAAGPFQAFPPIQSSSIRYAAPQGWGGGGSVTVPHAGSIVIPQ